MNQDENHEQHESVVQTLARYEQQIAVLEIQAKKCKWCGVPHERGMNTLCPFTIAEARLDAVENLLLETAGETWIRHLAVSKALEQK